MRVLLTGGSGFIGRHLSEILRRRGDDVTVLTRNAAKTGAGMTVSRVAVWDPLSGPAPLEQISSEDAVVNLLGESIAGGRWSARRKQRIRESRIVGTRNLVEGIARSARRPKVLVSGSAIGYYGPRGDEEIDESASAGGDFLSEVSRAWEDEARRAESLGVRVVLLRTGIVLGAKGGALASMLTPFKLGLGGPIGTGSQWMSWIHLDDLCGLIVHALQEPSLSGPLNGTAPFPVRQREFAKTLGAVLNRPAFLPVPALALRILLGEMAGPLLLSGQKVMPNAAQRTGYRFKHPTLEDALRSLLGRED
jgi:uncharacterized protein (TIGR01777 family)